MKKILACLLACLFMSLSLSSCDKGQPEEELGEINDVTIEDNEEAYADKNVFKKLDDELGYTYARFTVPRASMSFELPTSWEITIHNGRHLEINAPEDDPILPAQTINIMYKQDLSNNQRTTPGAYAGIFGLDLYNAEYNIDGNRYVQDDYILPDLDCDNAFTDRTDLISYEFTEDIIPYNRMYGKHYNEKCDAHRFYVCWNEYPSAFTAICNKDRSEKVKNLLTYIVSSIKYEPQKLASYTTETSGNLELPIPSDFIKENESDIFICDSNRNLSACSGMAIGVFHVDETDINAAVIDNEYAENIASYYISEDKSSYILKHSCVEQPVNVSLNGAQATSYFVTYSFYAMENEPLKYYQSGQSWMMQTYLIPDENGTNIITVFFQDSQFELGMQLCSLLEQQIKVKK